MEQFVATRNRIDKGGDFVPGRQDRCPGKSAAAGWQRWTEVYLGGAWQLRITPRYVTLASAFALVHSASIITMEDEVTGIFRHCLPNRGKRRKIDTSSVWGMLGP